MRREPAALLSTAYVASGATGLVVAALGGGALAALATFWIGGALAAIVLGARRTTALAAADADEAARAAARWEQDRLADRTDAGADRDTDRAAG